MTATAVERLRRALSATAEQPRRIVDFDLPLSLDRLLEPLVVDRLKPAAVLVPILARPEGATLLLTRRAETLRTHKGQISFPGGRRDDEDPSLAHAALREAHEEVGLAPERVELLGYLDDYPTITGYRITPVVGLVDPHQFEPVTDPGEVAEVFELPLAMVAAEEDRFERRSLIRDGLRLPFYELNHDGRRIWGATAGILWELRRVAQAALR